MGPTIKEHCKTTCGMPCDGANSSNCDADQAMVEVAAAGGHTISGCADVQPFCEDAAMGPTIKEHCKTTCGVPCTSGCDDNQAMVEVAAAGGHTISGCGDVQSFCEDAAMGPTIKEHCKATCGVPCDGANSKSCDADQAMVEVAAAGGHTISGCTDVQSLCEDAAMGPTIKEHCKTTCGVPCDGANSSSCDDDQAMVDVAAAGGHTINGCADVQSLCEDAAMGPAIKEHCKTTCGVPCQSGQAVSPKPKGPKTFADLGWRTYPEHGTHPKYAPNGIGPKDPKIFYEALHSLAKPPFDYPMAALSMPIRVYELFQIVGYNSQMFFKNENGNNSEREFEFACMSLFAQNLVTDEDIMKSINAAQAVVDESPLKDKAFLSGATITFWSTFLSLDRHTWTLLGVCLSAIGVITAAFLCSLKAAIAAVLICAMISLEVYGVLMIFLKFNPFVVAILLAATGLSVENVAHTIAAFMLESEGSSADRLGQAMKSTFLPIVHGSMSTIVAIIPLIGAKIEFIFLYQGLSIIIAVCVGVLNGLVFLPAMLGLLSMSRGRAC